MRLSRALSTGDATLRDRSAAAYDTWRETRRCLLGDLMTLPLLTAEGLSKRFGVGSDLFGRPRAHVHAVSDVSLAIAPGETLGLVGESGSGKSTLGRLLVGLERSDGGIIDFAGERIRQPRGRDLRAMRRRVQMIFQDPYASLDPRMTVGQSVGEPLTIHKLSRGAAARERVRDLFDQVGLRAEMVDRYPHALSGGQRQRVGIARALAVEPQLIVADEPVAALDVSIQAQIVNLLLTLQAEHGLAFLFISHDIAVVAHISHRIAVMYLGELVETGTAREIIGTPRHPYTEALIAATPDPARRAQRKIVPVGEIPSPTELPSGCRYHTRCPLATALCQREKPMLSPREEGRSVACHHR